MKQSIEKIVNFNIKNHEIYKQAFVHKSCSDVESNERLEFIGDSVLNFVVAHYLYEKYPHEYEGFLTRIRTKMVSGKALSKIALDIKLDEHIQMNEKAMNNGWNKNSNILEDALESLIGAVYLDAGVEKATKFIHEKKIESFDENVLLEDTNYKDILMRYVQGRKVKLPEYKLINELKTGFAKEFQINIYIEGKIVSEGIHKVKKQAEQIAAKRALTCFNLV